MTRLSSFQRYGFILATTLFLTAMGSCGDVSTNTATSTTDTLPTPLYELPLSEHQVALYGHLDDQLYVQIIDTSATATTERRNAPVYTCDCQRSGTCKISASGPHAISCVPKGESCSADSPFPDDHGHRCKFSETKIVPSGLRTVMTLTSAFNGRHKEPMPFDAEGLRAPNYYTMEFKDAKQLQAKYTLKSGEVLVEYVPEGRGDPVRVTCSCSCPSGSDCEMTVNSSNSISCYSKSSCMPKINGTPCDGCRFKTVALSAGELSAQTVEKKVLGE